MSTPTAIRWSGMALLLSGGFIAVSTIVHPGGQSVSQMLQTRWELAYCLVGVWSLLALFGLIGVYARYARQTGKLGLAGFGLSLVGTAMLASCAMIAAIVVPTVAEHSPHLVESGGPLLRSIEPYFAVAALTWLVGQVLLFGVAGFRAGVLSRGGSGLIVAGTVLVAGSEGLLPWPIVIAGALLLGSGSIWIGYGLWSGREAVERHPALALATE